MRLSPFISKPFGSGGLSLSGSSDTQVLFNDGGALAGDSGLTFNKTTNALTTSSLALGGATIGSHALAVTGTSIFSSSVTGTAGGNPWFQLFNGGLAFASTNRIYFSSNASATSTADASIMRVGAAVIGIRDLTTGGAALSLVEQTAPSAPAANSVLIYAVDNGGKTQLMAIFPTGAAQQIAIEP